MTSATTDVFTDADFHAYADGQLAAHRVREFEAELARVPELALRIAEIRAHNAALRDALDPILSEPIPERLVSAAVPPARGGGAVRRLIVSSLAAAAVLVVGISVGWIARDAMLERAGTPTTFARQAALTHALYAADARRPVEVWANEEKGLVTWLTKRLGFQVRAPNLNDVGFALVGGRLVAGNENPTALFMYENADHVRLSLQVRKQSPSLSTGQGGTGETAFRYAVANGVGVFYWIDDDCGYAISGNVDRSQLLKIAQVVYGQLAALEAAAPQ
jgi:anti-sigma factor RsiW